MQEFGTGSRLARDVHAPRENQIQTIGRFTGAIENRSLRITTFHDSGSHPSEGCFRHHLETGNNGPQLRSRDHAPA